MKTLFIVIALSSFFAGLASASTDIGWGGGGGSSIDTRPSIGGRVEIEPPIYAPPAYEPPRYPHYEPRYDNSGNRVVIHRYHRHRHCRHRHWHDDSADYEIYGDEPVVRIEVPRYERRQEVEIDAPAIREMVGNILGVNFSARWN
jgi:hypothetical protein